MLGIADFWVAAAYVLCILSTVLCVIYGALMWNKGGGDDVATDDDVAWVREEERIEEEL